MATSPEPQIPSRPERFPSVRFTASTGSTNADLMALAAEGAETGTVLVADHQTSGRGRQNRTWYGQPGNALLVSVLLRPDPSLAPLLTLTAGLAAVDAVLQLVEPSDDEPVVGLKWPNDVLVPALDERKLAGILAEATSVPGGDGLVVVVGMGLNLRWASGPAAPPSEVAARSATLEEVCSVVNPIDRPVPDRDAVLAAFLRSLDHWLSLAEAEGSGPILSSFRPRCLTLERSVRFETPDGVVEGRAVDVADDGGLVVERSGGRETLRAGDAHHV